MIFIAVFYWIVCGIASVGVGREPNEPLPVTVICFILGGFIVPALLVRKLID